MDNENTIVVNARSEIKNNKKISIVGVTVNNKLNVGTKLLLTLEEAKELQNQLAIMLGNQ
jgi:hypothetical protein